MSTPPSGPPPAHAPTPFGPSRRVPDLPAHTPQTIDRPGTAHDTRELTEGAPGQPGAPPDVAPDAAPRAEGTGALGEEVDTTLWLRPSPAVPPLPIGQRIGPYRVDKAIGRGGMGAVYLARRADGAFAKRVAIKVLEQGLDRDDIVHRFRREGQILASFEHPNIARLLDAGTTGDGRPFLVMEYVEGVSVDRYCDRRRLGIADRLRLMETICAAVGSAHRRQIVHRDLKPSNILVTHDGIPKLLDFGIAKLLAPEATDLHITDGAHRLRLLTPAYASPEQVLKGTITPASDVYALGVVLYELLCGRRPYATGSHLDADLLRRVCWNMPPPPSQTMAPARRWTPGSSPRSEADLRLARRRNTTPRALTRALAGDLDHIVLCALAKVPAQRYGTVDRLANDLRSHRLGLPVDARPATLVYRFRRGLRRHRTLVLTALVTALLTAALTLAITAQLGVGPIR